MFSVLRSFIYHSPHEQPASSIKNVQDVVNCALESVNTDQVLSEVIHDANQQLDVLNLCAILMCPQFHSVGQMHIHYHTFNNSTDNNQNDFLLVITTFHKL